MINKNKKKIIGIFTIAIGLLFVLSANLFAKDKKGDRLQEILSPYNFKYDIKLNDKCCFDVTVTAPAVGDAGHHFKVIANGVKYYDFDFGFTYPNFDPNKGEVSFEVCPPPGADNPYEINIQIYCNENNLPMGHEASSHTETLKFCDLPITEECCIIYTFDTNEYPIEDDFTIDFGCVDENDDFIVQETGRLFENCLLDADTNRYIVVCPCDGDRTHVNYRIKVRRPNGTLFVMIEGDAITTCCNCEYTDFGPLSLVPVDDPTCTGCAFKLDYANRIGLPDYTDCYNSLEIEYANLTGIVKTMNFDLESFNPDDFGIFCLEDGVSKGFIQLEFINSEFAGEDENDNCTQFFSFDCKGIIYTPDSLDNTYPEAEPCSPDCDSIPWTRETGSLTMITASGVSVTASYVFYWKDCDFQDIQVTEIIYSGILPDPFDEEGEVFTAIIEQITEYNVMDFKPRHSLLPANGTEVCDTTWRISMGSCWATQQYVYSDHILFPGPFFDNIVIIGEGTPLDTSDFVQNHFIEYPISTGIWGKYKKKCDDVDCCKQRLEVCKTKDNDGLITTETKLMPTAEDFYTCEYSYTWVKDATANNGAGQWYWAQCEPMCDWLTELEFPYTGPPLEKISINEQNDLAIAKYNLKDFYSNEQISISFSSNGKNSIEVHLYDISGVFIITEKSEFATGEHNYTINTGQLKTGTYYYIIIINNTLIKSNKFIIVR